MDNWLKKQALLSGDKLAVTDGTNNLTFAELNQRATQIAGQLNSLGLLQNERIALLTNNTLAGYLTAMAILTAGHTIVWLNRRLSTAELNYQLTDSQVDFCLFEPGLETTGLLVKTVSLTDLFAAPVTQNTLQAEFKETEPASIMYTSGTTGRPKGVVQTFGNHLNSALASALNMGVSPADEWLCTVPIFHISGFSIMMRGLIYGMTVRLVEHFDAREIHKILVEEPITMISVVPYMLKKLLRLKDDTKAAYNQRFQGMLLGGGPIDRSTLELCEQLKIPVVQSYGMTETCSQIIALSFADAANHIGSSGKPLFLTQLRIASKTSEIQVKTPALTPGYLGQPAKYTAKITPDGWFKTGDVGHLDEDGFLYVDGRSDDMIISGGENIFPDEIESVYADCDQLEEMAVIGIDDELWEQKPIAFIVSKSNELSAQALLDYGRARLAHYKVPRTFYVLDHLPYNASGKLQRYKLHELLASKTPVQQLK
ncbi:2-succinylbenzoate--CoA ligase [Ligilactobacillus salitolerans]|uniref:2-succinylbenzoate--CoA ligase n=1 Tax=Ligilactobacillus salitolerans TaxID=1808352 RepID=A0A401IT87_9LACO|nr:o-succinylbenzoate--CoA ligase [Ligilactobacillus salitolerans]GBG94742.1 2-succinylbenzoate--CoA ligase [Ligilactobacillus salitolerans]